MQYNNFHYLNTWASCGTAQSSLLTKARVTYVAAVHWFFFCPRFEHIIHLLWGFDFSVLGATFLRERLSVSLGFVFLNACSPGTCRLSAACAYFMNKPSTNSVLYVSCCMFLPMTCLQATTELRTVDSNCLLKSLRYLLVIIIQPCTYAATGPSSWPPLCCDCNQSHIKASLFSS